MKHKWHNIRGKPNNDLEPIIIKLFWEKLGPEGGKGNEGTRKRVLKLSSVGGVGNEQSFKGHKILEWREKQQGKYLSFCFHRIEKWVFNYECEETKGNH